MRHVVPALLVGWFGVTIPAAHAELPVIPPIGEPAKLAQKPGEVVPPAPMPGGSSSAVPAIETSSTPVMELKPWTVTCQPSVVCADPCRTEFGRRLGILSGLKNWLCGTDPVVSCPAPCPAACPVPCPPVTKTVHCPPAPQVVRTIPVPCPVPPKPAVACPPIETKTVRHMTPIRHSVGNIGEKLKNFLCWKPCNEQLLPILTPAPYHAPAMAYLGPCREPADALPCGTCKKHSAQPCKTGTCMLQDGPTTVAASKIHPVIGWTPIYANYTIDASKIVPATATTPVEATKPANPLSRPFTSP